MSTMSETVPQKKAYIQGIDMRERISFRFQCPEFRSDV